ncbi:MAG: endonuclease III [Desulfobacteraceae bacterium]
MPDTFPVTSFVETLRQEYPKWKAPVVTLIASTRSTPFQILISTVISLRTKDQVTLEATKRLFSRVQTPGEMVGLDAREIEKLIHPAGFSPTKSKRIREISRILLQEYDGKVPDTMEKLLELPGVGRKTANLVLVEAFGKPGICVDTHVHRISNRIGYISTGNAEKTETALREKLPLKHWEEYNRLLVAFGQVICRPVSPKCGECPVYDMCRYPDKKIPVQANPETA